MADATTPAEDAPKKKGGLMVLIKAVAFIGVIVLIEVAAASMFIPSADETMEIAERLHSDQGGEENVAEEGSEPGETLTDDMVEVPLNDDGDAFHVLRYDPNSGASLNIDFTLAAVVLADEESEFFNLYNINKHRIHEQVDVTMRGVEVVDLTDPNLGLIKRKILEKVNRALGKPLLREVIVGSFAFFER